MGGGVGQGIGQIFGARSQAQAMERQGAFVRAEAEFNARQAEKNAEESRQRGVKAVAKQQLGLKQFIGNQRVALAAQGIVVDEGTASSLQEQTREIGLADSLMIRNNAMKEAYGYEFESMQIGIQGRMAQANAMVGSAQAQFAGNVGGIASISGAVAGMGGGGGGKGGVGKGNVKGSSGFGGQG